MKPDYASLRAEALVTCELPPRFADWPKREQQELLRLAELSSAEARAEVNRLSAMKPEVAGSLERTSRKVADFVDAVRRMVNR